MNRVPAESHQIPGSNVIVKKKLGASCVVIAVDPKSKEFFVLFVLTEWYKRDSKDNAKISEQPPNIFWELPGGEQNANESFFQTAIRETSEETDRKVLFEQSVIET